ncbi:MAG: coproporphyrinogen dehydrogenase HemZ, partial [Clostridia bacterium]|nr:coproporphyrinogen dehydrogenase HemZ [Clostridia bacterium]
LIAGLADETPEDFENSLNTAISLNPANITVHTLSLKSGAKLKEETKKLNVNGIGEMIALSRKLLTEAGYEPYYLYRQKYQAGGLENVGWTKPNKACVYNVDTMEEISSNIAVGANAISKRYFSDEDRIERYAAPKDIPTYISKIEEIIAKRNKLFK